MKKAMLLLLAFLFCIGMVSCAETHEIPDVAYTTVDLPQLGKYGQRLYHTATGKLTPGSTEDTVSVLAEEPLEDAINTQVYLLANQAGKTTTYPLGKWETVILQNGTLSLFDIDKDGADEVFLWQEITGNGGTLTQVYKCVDEALVLWQDLAEIEVEIQGEFLEGQKLRLFNQPTGFNTVIDLEGFEEYADADGKINLKPDLQWFPIDSCSASNDCVSCTRPMRHNGGGCAILEIRFVYDAVQRRLVLDDMCLERTYYP